MTDDASSEHELETQLPFGGMICVGNGPTAVIGGLIIRVRSGCDPTGPYYFADGIALVDSKAAVAWGVTTSVLTRARLVCGGQHLQAVVGRVAPLDGDVAIVRLLFDAPPSPAS